MTRASVVLFASLLAGCTVGPVYQQPGLPLPTEYSDSNSSSFDEQGIGLSRWWEAFGDQTLNDLIMTSFENNHDLRLGALRILEARANLGINRSGYSQEIALAGSAATSEGSEHTSAIVAKTENYTFGTDLSWELDFWGRIRRTVESSEAALNATESDFRDLRIVIASEVTNAYIRLRSAQQRLALTQDNVSIQEKALSDTRAQFEEGDNTLLDVAQAEAVYADTQSLIPSLIRERINARNTLATLLALPFEEIDSRVSNFGSLPWLDNEINIGVPAELIRQRPDIQTAEWNAIGAAAEVGIREAERRPSINLSGSLLFQVIDGIPTKAGGPNGSSFDDLFEGDSLSYSVLPSLRLPLFDGTRRKNAVRAADARYQSALERLEQTVIGALQEVDDSMTQVETSKSEANYLEASVTAYIKAYETAAIQYEEGDIPFVSVLDSLRQRVSQELNLVRARSNVSLGIVSLFKSLGGGWQDVSTPMLREDMAQEMRERTSWGDLLGEEE